MLLKFLMFNAKLLQNVQFVTNLMCWMLIVEIKTIVNKLTLM